MEIKEIITAINNGVISFRGEMACFANWEVCLPEDAKLVDMSVERVAELIRDSIEDIMYPANAKNECILALRSVA